MDIKKLAVGAVVAGIAMHLVNTVVGMVPVAFFANNFMADWQVWSIVAAVFHGAVLALVLGWKGVGDHADAAKAGATFGVAMALAMNIGGGVNAALIGALVAGAVVHGAGGVAIAMAGGGGSDG